MENYFMVEYTILMDFIMKGGGSREAQFVDRMLFAAMIEARSCERFVLLRDHLEDPALQAFYGRLYESEARHHATYVRLAKQFSDDHSVNLRLQELAVLEAAIIEEGCELPRVHS